MEGGKRGVVLLQGLNLLLGLRKGLLECIGHLLLRGAAEHPRGKDASDGAEDRNGRNRGDEKAPAAVRLRLQGIQSLLILFH